MSAATGTSVRRAVDLNTASLEELDSLEGGGKIGRAIISARPYASPDDLVRKRVLTRADFDRIKDQVTVE
jgi:DNA uptake protein ComE-like DNA-binding protein